MSACVGRFFLGTITAILLCSSWACAHEGGHGDSKNSRTWYLIDGSHLHGSYIASDDDNVQILTTHGKVRSLPLAKLKESTRTWVLEKKEEITRLHASQSVILVSHRSEEESQQEAARPAMADAFAPFASTVNVRWDRDFLFVESNGIPDHPMMVGIRSWQQQVPLPQPYRGDNAWRIPLHPVPAKKPISANGRFLRGAIALAVNGIPIFNPLNNRGDDAYLVGELDEFGGHCGRADDYHYHLAPVHLEKIVGKGNPIGYALDGYPIYGYQDPAAPDFAALDALNGHRDAQGNYHYHATPKYPYLNGGFFGEVVERDGQVDPQPRAQGVREALPPMRGATITRFEQAADASTLTYEIQGKPGTVRYVLQQDGSYQFVFTDPSGRTTTETYRPRTRGPGGGGRGPGRPPEKPSPSANRRATDPANEKGKERSISLSSSSIDGKGALSAECSCDGKGQSPAVAWKNLPEGTQSVAVSMWHEAPDREKSYWLVYNIPNDVSQIEQNSKRIGTLGQNDKKRAEYDPVCSKGPGAKIYHITVYAFSKSIDLKSTDVNRSRLVEEFKKHGLGEQTLDVTYERK
ncbi:MAG: YHYH protein [Planctomycetota bacterium]|jgi:phosphatidylethanolamine-binding protein (PEBP) family uncharacterized protein